MEAGAKLLKQSIRIAESRIPAQESVQSWIQGMRSSNHAWPWHEVQGRRSGMRTGESEASRLLCSESSRAGSELQVGRCPFSVRVMLKLAVPGQMTVLARSGWNVRCLLSSQYNFFQDGPVRNHPENLVIVLHFSFLVEFKPKIKPHLNISDY